MGKWCLNLIHYGNNIDVIRQLDETFTVAYLDPPYMSGKNWGEFSDTFTADEYMKYMDELMAVIEPKMAENSVVFIQCDWHGDSYNRIVAERYFKYLGPIYWKRSNNTGSGKSMSRKPPQNTDTILCFAKGDKYVWNYPSRPIDGSVFNEVDEKGEYYWASLRHYKKERLEELKAKGEIKKTRNGTYMYKLYRHRHSGKVYLDNVWDDIKPVKSTIYPTEKPVELISRLLNITDHSNVLDPFMGSGVVGIVAKNYTGIDMNPNAIYIAASRTTHKIANPPEPDDTDLYFRFLVGTTFGDNDVRYEAPNVIINGKSFHYSEIDAIRDEFYNGWFS